VHQQKLQCQTITITKQLYENTDGWSFHANNNQNEHKFVQTWADRQHKLSTQ